MNVIGFKEAKCKNCFKCVRICDVKAITIKNEQAEIMSDKCILCGHCLEACPQNAKTFISDIDLVKSFLDSNHKTVVSIAPSYLGVLDFDSPGQVVTALKLLGFHAVRETAEGAAYVTREYEHLLLHSKMDNIITTCCPSVNDLIEIYYPSLIASMAPVVSPMIAHGKLIKKVYGNDTKVVFLGPCIAKKREAVGDDRTKGYIDAVITFQELKEWLLSEQIHLHELNDTPLDNPDPCVHRLYPISSGVISSVITSKQEVDRYRKFYVHGMKNCIELFESMQKGEISGSFIEVNLCNGGCIKGTGLDREVISRFKVKLDMEEKIKKEPISDPNYFDHLSQLELFKVFRDRSPSDPLPSEREIRNILKQIGKTKKEHELNCGACGYSSCRDKAIAVYQGKAELNMCIPYMHEKAQSMANVVLDTTPNIILIVDSDMKIIEFSKAAQGYFHLSRATAKEKYLYELIDHTDFETVLTTHKNILGKKVTYPELGITTLQNIVYVEEQNGVLGIFQDITMDEDKQKQAYKMKIETIEMAQRVIDKQMLVAQEIAGLLGETTAETKVTLTKLRDTIIYDGER